MPDKPNVPLAPVAPVAPLALLAPLDELAPAYWRLLVSRVPQIAADRLARDIRSGRFAHAGLLLRANDLRDHTRARVRERARAELLPALAQARAIADTPNAAV